MGSLASQRAPRLRSGLTRETQYRQRAAAYMQHLRARHSQPLPSPAQVTPLLESPQWKVPCRKLDISSFCSTPDAALWPRDEMLVCCQTSTLTLLPPGHPFHAGSWGVTACCSLLHWPFLPALYQLVLA